MHGVSVHADEDEEMSMASKRPAGTRDSTTGSTDASPQRSMETCMNVSSYLAHLEI
jgi:hypothetical protein